MNIVKLKITRRNIAKLLGIGILMLFIGKQIQIMINDSNSKGLQWSFEENKANYMSDSVNAVLQVTDPSFELLLVGEQAKEYRYMTFSIDNLSRADINMVIKDCKNRILFDEIIQKSTYMITLPDNFDGNLIISFNNNQFEECVVDFGEGKLYSTYILLYQVLFTLLGVTGSILVLVSCLKKKNVLIHLTKVCSKKGSLLVFLSFFVFLCIQHYLVALYFDDWSYLSLSYQYRIEGVNGRNYNLAQIFSFLRGHYQVWGGRILYFGIFIATARIRIMFYKFIQATTILAIFYILYRMLIKQFPEKKWLTALSLCSMYGLISIQVHNSGTYWFSAAAVYVLPLLPTFFLIYCLVEWWEQEKTDNYKRRAVGSSLLAFFASFSQEQIGFAIVGILTIFLLASLIKKRCRKWVIPSWITGVVGFLILYLAPGNQIRMKQENIAMGKRIIQAVFNTVFGIFNVQFLWILVAFLLYICYSCIWRLYNKHGNQVICKLYLIISMIIMGRFLLGRGTYFTNVLCSNQRRSKFVWLCILSLYLLWSMVELGLYLWERERRQIFYLLIFAILTLVPCFYASYFSGRMVLPVLFSLIGIIANGLCEIREDQIIDWDWFRIISLGVVLFCWIQLLSISIGYGKNYRIFMQNEHQLQDAACENLQIVKLKQNKNDTYASYMPYQGGPLQGFVENGMKRYYGIQEDCVFEWYDEIK